MERVIVWHRWSPTSEPSREAVSVGTQWRLAARERFLAVDATVLSEIGGTGVFALEPSQLGRAVELCLTAVREAEREDSGVGAVACGVALGSIELDEEERAYAGDPLDRAQALAHAAALNDVVLDNAAQVAASSSFLFAREVRSASGVGGAVLDRAFPRRSECQRALSHLGRPPFPVNGSTQFEALRRLARTAGRQRVLLIGPHGIGIGQWIARIAAETSAPLWLDIRALGASLAPLSGLSYALRRLPTSATPEHVLSQRDDADSQACTTLVAIRDGRAVSRRDAIVALRQLVARCADNGRRPLLSVDPAALIDPSTVGVFSEAARESGPDALFVLRLLHEGKAPEAFARGGELAEIRVRGLSLSEARGLSASMLGSQGNDVPTDVARRAVTMGGENPLAVATALRVLVASGDVVFESGSARSDELAPGASQRSGFRWRRGPAGRPDTMSLDELLEERIDTLAAPLRRVLEVLVTVPDPDERELASEVAQVDGLLEETWERAVEELDRLGLVRLDARGIDISPALRQVVHGSMAPARSLELHGSVARALAQKPSESDDDFGRATLAYYLAHAGQMTEAASVFLAVAARAGSLGFLRSGVRLAAAAVECDPSETTRARAAQIAERLSERQSASTRSSGKSTGTMPALSSTGERPAPRSTTPPGNFATAAGARAVQALLARDFDEVERAIELLVAAGSEPAAVDRLRIVILLVKGDAVAASALLQKLSEAATPTPPARLLLTTALVNVARGDVGQGLRACLETLARARRARDLLGERASLSVLSLCYRKLGREADAARLADAALAPGAPRSPDPQQAQA
ncbi:MAG: transcriptional regulator, family protein [Myxococcaceae bacterium]|nr:transcriptional regulator, family protein [Myxococcaceae bacterium]